MNNDESPLRIVVMGVSGCGKSTVAKALARDLGGLYLDADDLHSEHAVAKMAAGKPLTDADRVPWLERVGEALADGSVRGAAVVACSALRRSYRDILRQRAGDVMFIHLKGSSALIASRLEARSQHFMPPSLLASQFATLEDLEPDERGTEVPIDRAVAQIVEDVRTEIARSRDLASRQREGISSDTSGPSATGGLPS